MASLVKKIGRFSPGRILLSAIIATIAIGSFLLSLPICVKRPLPFIDILFTATSLTCVTGLFTVSLHNFTPFGHLIMLILMQIGGLGLVTMTIFILSLFIEFGFGAQILAGKLLELESWSQIRHLLLFIVKVTLIIELLGAVFIFPILFGYFPLIKALFLSLFHSVSSFCDAGISLFPYGMISFQRSYAMILITSFLMVCGGLGFIVWDDLIHFFAAKRLKRRAHLSLHTKITLSTTIGIIIVSTFLMWVLERNNAFASMNFSLSGINALFLAISSRGVGFTTVPSINLQLSSLLLIMILAFIGASPGSTGGGIKTTSFAIFLMTIKTAITGKFSVQMKGRKIPRDQTFKALAIIALSQIWIIAITFILLITERGWDFLDVLFEVTSAFATLGISLGITPYLSILGKLFIIITMIVGRIGSLTLILALRKKSESVEYEYPEERVLLG